MTPLRISPRARPSRPGPGVRRLSLGGLRRGLALATISVVAVLTACDSGPDGPGTVNGRVTGASDLGAVVLDVVWTGVQGFEGHGSTQVYTAAVPGQKDRYRVILLDPTGGELSFGMLVDDVYLEGPVVTVIEAADAANEPRAVGDLRVVLDR